MRLHCVTLLALAFMGLSGCSAFLPAHSRSAAINESRVEIEFVPFAQLEAKPEFKADYIAAFGEPAAKVARVPEGEVVYSTSGVGAAALAGVVVSAAIDYVSDRLGEEAQRYEAQFSHAVAKDNFWTRENKAAEDVKQTYAGFIIRRWLHDEEQPAFECAFGFAPSADGQMFRLQPLSFITRQAKAKVLSDSLWWELLPTAWFRYAAGTTGHSVDTDVSVEIDAYYRSGKDQEMHVAKVAAMQVGFTAYDLDATLHLRRSSCGHELLKTEEGGWLVGCPLSVDRNGKGITGPNNAETQYGGTFVVKVLVTERDTSNAKKYLERASKLVADSKEKVMKLVVPGSTNTGGAETQAKPPVKADVK